MTRKLRPEGAPLNMPKLGIGKAKTEGPGKAEEVKPAVIVEDGMDRAPPRTFAPDTSIKSPQEQLTALLLKIADTVPLYPRAGARLKGGGGRFAEVPFDEGAVYNTTVVQGFRGPMIEPRVNPAILDGTAEVEGQTTVGAATNYTNAYERWADTPHHALWTSPYGQAFAAYCLHRYGLGDEAGITGGKIGHVAGVTFASRVIHAQQQADFSAAGGGELINDAWAQRLELSAIAHDIGYMHGPLMHPGRGAQDLLANFGKYVTNTGLLDKHDAEDQVETEKVAVLAAMHGGRFPWDQLHDTLASSTYIMADLAERMVGDAGLEKLKGIIRNEYAEYLEEPAAKGAPEKLGWLDEPGEMQQLIRAGFMVHCADNFNGPRRGTYDSLATAAKEGRLSGKTGSDMPIRDEVDLHNLYRASQSDRLMGDLDSTARNTVDFLQKLNKALLEGTADISSASKLESSLKAVRPKVVSDGELPEWSSSVIALSNALVVYANTIGEETGKDLRSGEGTANMNNDDLAKFYGDARDALEEAITPILAELPKVLGGIAKDLTKALADAKKDLRQLDSLPELA